MDTLDTYVGLARRRPPGPAGPVDMPAMRRAPLDFLAELARRYGDITMHQADGDTVYTLNRPEWARHVLRDNGANYTKKRTPDDFMLRPLLGNGLLTSNGPEWAAQRHMCAPAFRPAEVARFDTVIVDAAERMLAAWRPAIASGQPLAVDHHLTALTLAVITRAILGANIEGVGEGFGRAVDDVNRFIGHYIPAEDPDPADTAQRHRDYRRGRAFLDAVTRTLISARRATGTDEANLLNTMMTSHHIVSDTDLRDQVLTIVMAGHETTAKSLTWTLYLLDRHPEEAAKVYGEVDRVLAGRRATAADYPRLEACRRAVQEAMRLYPPVWLTSRRATGPDVVGGYDVAPGTLVCVSQWMLHRHPEYWDRPDAYLPDRFADTTSLPSHLYLPFGGGDRICIGQHFAMLEATLVLATIAQHVRLTLVPGHPVVPEALVTLRPKHGMRMVAGPRETQ
ncbi:cytochrome P450 [Yinghuangia seranimata]|uniref:cytochrome P450 n=1 Tax=Yinghuangia seranimata TaxID=408067 RepID=UPI00248B4AE2|nr:cytochrome P450 [Yinghuangia seranimata]MDI2130068.1 cytochrome P450 [Yinghuangia seranimata]